MLECFPPEIKISKLPEFILILKSLGIHHLHFDFLSKPSERQIIKALETLFALKFIDENANLIQEKAKLVVEYSLDV